MTGTELFQWLEENFTHHRTVQFKKSDIKDSFKSEEKAALTALFEAYKATSTINGVLLAVIWLDEKDEAVAYLDKVMKNFS